MFGQGVRRVKALEPTRVDVGHADRDGVARKLLASMPLPVTFRHRPMKLYMTSGSCTTGIHILLETLELPFEAWIISIPAGDQLAPDYVAINPKYSIPTLVRDDGSTLTEFPSIAWWLARTHPKAKLLPTETEGEPRVLEVMDYVVGTLHGWGFARIFATGLAQQ